MDLRPGLVTYLDDTWPGAQREPLSGDASTRRFLRLIPARGHTRVVMDYGAPFSGDTDDVILQRILSRAGLPVAAVIAVVPAAGCLVLEDLGDRTLQLAIGAEPDEAPTLLRRAVQLAVRIAEDGTAALATSERANGPALDAERFRFEMDFFAEHYLLGLLDAASVDPGLHAALYRLAEAAADCPRSICCHRDYHTRNLMVREDGSLALVDIQDARWGPDSYDLASLLFDAYIDEVDPLRSELIESYLAYLAAPPPEAAFRRRLGRVGAQRMLKALGTFGYQIHVRGNEVYRPAVPRTLRRLAELLPELEGHLDLHDRLSAAGLWETGRPA